MKFIVTSYKRMEEVEYLWNNCSEEIEKNAISEGIIIILRMFNSEEEKKRMKEEKTFHDCYLSNLHKYLRNLVVKSQKINVVKNKHLESLVIYSHYDNYLRKSYSANI